MEASRSSNGKVEVTSQTPAQADAQEVSVTNRGHWTIENRCHYVIDRNFDEGRSRIRTGHGPENVTRLRRFAVGALNLFGHAKASISKKMANVNRNTRWVFD
jgi:predicted transposase YbfD/YdcC